MHARCHVAAACACGRRAAVGTKVALSPYQINSVYRLCDGVHTSTTTVSGMAVDDQQALYVHSQLACATPAPIAHVVHRAHAVAVVLQVCVRVVLKVSCATSLDALLCP